MDDKTARMLCEITNRFYRDNAASFSATRQRPWPGWTVCLERMGGFSAHDSGAHNPDECAPNTHAPDTRSPGTPSPGTQGFRTHGLPAQRSRSHDGSRKLTIFDLACGNLRFADFLAGALPGADITVYAVDNCDALLPLDAQAPVTPAGDAQVGVTAAGDTHAPRGRQPHISYQSLDILETLHGGQRLSDCITAPRCGLSVSFGLMHHVPLAEHRAAILAALVEQTRPGGFVAVSFWQFLNDETRAFKAQATQARALQELGLPQLGDNDFLLGWKNTPGTYRYCHSFTDAEIDQLAESVARRASTLARFTADGRTGKLNSYLILRVH